MRQTCFGALEDDLQQECDKQKSAPPGFFWGEGNWLHVLDDFNHETLPELAEIYILGYNSQNPTTSMAIDYTSLLILGGLVKRERKREEFFFLNSAIFWITYSGFLKHWFCFSLIDWLQKVLLAS